MKKKLWLGVLALCLGLPATPAMAIVNGSAAADGAYPWMAAFLQDGNQICGGSVIAPNWILTAAHCVTDDRGQPSMTPAQATFRVNTNNWTDGNGQTLQADKIIVHPQYDAKITNNDIALVHVTTAATVTPVVLAGDQDKELNNEPTKARVIGYGATRTGGDASEQLLQVDVDVVADAKCRDSGFGQLVDATMLCAGNPTTDSNNPGRDSCQGDSGGPLFATKNGTDVQIGLSSFGGECGVHQPGVYTEITTYRAWIDKLVGGSQDTADPGPASQQPTGAAADPIRIRGGDGNDPVANAIAISQLVYQSKATYGVLASSTKFPDGLGGTALASYKGPLLYVGKDGVLGESTLKEFQRTLPQGATIYVLGGIAAVPDAAATKLTNAGFVVDRLAGLEREETARLIAEKVLTVVNEGQGTAFDSVIVAFARNWPDAVTIGQISAWFGIPVILTPTASLGSAARTYLSAHKPTSVIVMGGTAVISDNTVAEIEAITGADSAVRVAGTTRVKTGAEATMLNRYELYPRSGEVFELGNDFDKELPAIIAVNLRETDAFAHVLATAMVFGNFGGAVVSIDGPTIDQSVLDSICKMDTEVYAIGSTRLVPDSVLASLQQASAGTGCTEQAA